MKADTENSATASTSSGSSKNVRNYGVTLITNGYRIRLRDDGSRKIAKLPNGSHFDSYDDLTKAWDKAIKSVPEDDFVNGAGEPGIFSERFGQQIEQITERENAWCPTEGLGMVSLGQSYPQYDLGEAETDIRNITDKGVINNRQWWDFVTSLSGNSIASVVLSALKSHHRVIFAIPGPQFFNFKDDMRQLVDSLADSGGKGMMEYARNNIRFVGPDLETVVPPKLLACVMPYNKEALERLVPGPRAHGTRRLAALLLSCTSPTKNGSSAPLDDYAALNIAFADKKREPLPFFTGAVEKSKAEKLTEEDARSIVERVAAEVGDIPERIVRVVKSEGYSINKARVESALRSLKRAKK